MSGHFPSFYTDETVEDIERSSEWDAPHGFLFGGMATPTRKDLAGQYMTAATLLIAAIENKNEADYRLAYPIVYLYRHTVELLLKNVLGPSKNHDLNKLGKQLNEYVFNVFGRSMHPWILEVIGDLARYDENSMTFRYDDMSEADVPRKNQAKRHLFEEGEFHINLFRLQEQMDHLTDILVRIADPSLLEERRSPIEARWYGR